MPLNICVKHKLHLLLDFAKRPDIQWLAIVFLSFVVMLCQFYRRLIVPVNTPVPLLTVLADSTLLTLPMLWIHRRWIWTYWLVLTALAVYMIANILYACSYFSLMSISTMCMWGNVDKMVIEGAMDYATMGDLAFIAVPIVTATIWLAYYRRRIKSFGHTRKSRTMYIILAVIVVALAQIKGTIVYRQSYAGRNGEVGSFAVSMYDKIAGHGLSRSEYFDINGLPPFIIYLAYENLTNGMLSGKEHEIINKYISSRTNHIKYDKINNSKLSPPNFILIIVESLETWAIDYEQNGQYAMPFIHSLSLQARNDSDNTLFYPNILSQVSIGHSADGQLIIMSGILPLKEEVAANQYCSNTYPTIFRAFKKEYKDSKTFEITCDEGRMWHQGITYHGYGFEKYYGLESFDKDKRLNWFKRDKPMFDLALSTIQKSPEKYACMLVTLELHQPYSDTYTSGTWIDHAVGLTTESRTYLAKAANTDRNIRDFVEGLKRIGRYENTMIVITGDHLAYGMPEDKRLTQERKSPHYLPLIVLNSPVMSQYNKQIAGQVDIYPTLLDILGIENYGWRGVGHSLLRPGHPNAAINCEGHVVGRPNADTLRQLEDAWRMSQLIIRSNYFASHLP